MKVRLLILALVLMVPGILWAQPPMVQTLEVPLDLGSGAVLNPTRTTATVWSEGVTLPGVSSFRLRFGRVELNDPRDAVVVANVLDGQVQRLDREGLRRWQNLTGWFNGDAAVVGLDLAPGSSGSVQVVAAVALPGAPAGVESLCDDDNRAPSSEPRIFRLLIPGAPGGVGICTGFLINDRATYLTAGHCFSGLTDLTTVAEFNVPPSTTSGAIVHPFINDQFPGDPTTVLFNDDTPEHDWAVGRLHPNSFGENASAVHGFLTLSTAGENSFDGRVTGYGADTTPATRNYTQQTTTGPVSSPQFGSELTHRVDTQPGNSGSPLINVATNRVAGIHVAGGCDGSFIPLFPLPHNNATRITDSALQTAITNVGGCAGIHLENGDTAQVTCSPAIYSLDPQANHWNVVGVSSVADWDIVRENVGSTLNGNICDFLISNGTLGSVPPISGEIRRISNFSPATVQYVSAAPIQLNQTLATTWSSGRILRAFEFLVTGASPALHVTVSGEPSLRWHLYRPDVASGSPWFPRSAGLHSAGVVGGPTISNIPVTAAGTYCLVIYRDGGSAIPAISTLGVTIADGSTVPLPLAANTPANIGPGTPSFTLSPVAGSWNAVGVTAPADTALSLATGVSVTPGNVAEFVVANGRAGPIGPTSGLVTEPAGSASARIEHALPVSAATGSLITSSVPAGHVLKLLDVTVASTNSYQIVVSGDPSLRWALFDPAAGPQWLGPAEALAGGQVGGPNAARNLPAGSYALVVARNGGVATTDKSFNLRIGTQTTVLNLAGPGSFIGNLANPDYGFTCVPQPVRWNAVGSFGSLASGQTILMGGASSATSTFGTGFVVANAHINPVNPAEGILTHFGPAGGSLFQADSTPFNVGALGTVSWTSSMLLHLFEFNVQAAGVYNLNVTGGSGLAWMLFRPGTSSAWRPRSEGELLSSVGTAQNGVALQTGYHAIAVTRGGLTVPNGVVTCSATFAGNLAPVLGSVTPSSVVGGIPSATVIITGSGILSGCTAEWDGTINVGVIGTLGFVATGVPAAILAVPGQHTLRLVNPPPGGGPSSALIFTVRPPRVASVSPPAVAVFTPGAPQVTLTLDGADFLPGAVVHAGGRVLPTTFVNSGRLVATIDGSVAEMNAAGAAALTVENGHRAQSNTVALPVGQGGSNHGTAVRLPLDPFPGEPYVAVLEGGPPGGLFTWLMDFSSPAPITGWPTPAVGLVLGVGTPGTTFSLIDGFGLFGPAFPGAVYGFDPAGTAPGGTFRVPGFIWPQAPLNVRLTMQTVDLDPSQPLGFGLGWTRIEDL